jgi:eukaryotic-like serine/threonine-protein kinase
MGEVWRAHDTRIGRDVAVKVLPSAYAADPERLRRFQLEARAAGSTNHPNLVTIYEFGTEGDAPFLAMELLDGETLREKIGDGSTGVPVPYRKAIDYGIQLATGLAAAHEQGIVHRDLKLENVIVTRDGRVKVLDFGLAKLTESPSFADSLTQHRNTANGAVVGTVGYMSPEQVRGQQVDHRTDIFAFGTILYEMLTGRRAFRAGSSVETMNAILTEDPPDTVSSAQHISPALDRIVRRCLEKNREERFQSARDLAFALEALSGSNFSHDQQAPAAGTERPSRRKTFAVAAAAMLVAAALVAYQAGSRRSVAPDSPFLTQLTFEAGLEDDPAIAPSGETFLFVRDGDIYLQRTDGRNAINLTKTPAERESAPAFSPDGSQIAFHSSRDGGGIFVMGATGESARRISSRGFDPSWSPDGKQIVFTESEPTLDPGSRNTTISPMAVLDLGTGKSRTILESDAMQPRWSPDGRRIAFWANDNAGKRDIYTVSASGGSETVVPVTSDDALDWNPVWAPDGRSLFFSSDRNGTMALWRIAIDQKSGKVAGVPEIIPTPAASAGRISVSADGRRLVFQTRSSTNALFRGRVDRAASTVSIDEAPLLDSSLPIRAASSSPDGERIAFTTNGREDVFVMRSDGTDLRQLTSDHHRDRGATWTPDGEWIGFYSSRSGSYQVWKIRPDGSELTQVTDVPKDLLPNFPSWSPDGKRLTAVTTRGNSFIAELDELPVRTVDLLPPLPSGDGEFFATSWSPDGKRLAGTPWNGRRFLYIYSIDGGTYHPLHEGATGLWLDDRLLLTQEGDALSVTSWPTAEKREIARTRYSLSDTIPGSREHLVLYSIRTEADIWMATFPRN